MKNKQLKSGDKIKLPSGGIFLVIKKNKKNIVFLDIKTNKQYKQGLDLFISGSLIKPKKLLLQWK